MTVKAFCTKVSISKTTYNNLVLYGKSCDVKTLASISRGLEVSTDELLFTDLVINSDRIKTRNEILNDVILQLNERIKILELKMEELTRSHKKSLS